MVSSSPFRSLCVDGEEKGGEERGPWAFSFHVRGLGMYRV
jgi:hypothetical protein